MLATTRPAAASASTRPARPLSEASAVRRRGPLVRPPRCAAPHLAPALMVVRESGHAAGAIAPGVKEPRRVVAPGCQLYAAEELRHPGMKDPLAHRGLHRVPSARESSRHAWRRAHFVARPRPRIETRRSKPSAGTPRWSTMPETLTPLAGQAAANQRRSRDPRPSSCAATCSVGRGKAPWVIIPTGATSPGSPRAPVPLW